MASLSQSRTAAAQCGLFTHKSVPIIFEPPCILVYVTEIRFFFKFPTILHHSLTVARHLLPSMITDKKLKRKQLNGEFRIISCTKQVGTLRGL